MKNVALIGLGRIGQMHGKGMLMISMQVKAHHGKIFGI